MEGRGFWKLEGVSDRGLQAQLVQLLASSCRTEARILAHIAEVERRRLFLKEGFSDLYKYCHQRLGLSETEAYHRVTAARIARKYPIAFSLVEARKIHLSGLCKLKNFLTPANHQELFQVACGKTKQQIEELLAARYPGAPVQDSVRRLPPKRIAPVPAAPSSRTASEIDERGSAERRVEPGGPAPSFSHSTEVVDPITGEVTTRNGVQTRREAPSFGPPLADPTQGEAPASEVREPRYRVQFEASSALKAKIELARALSRHSNPKGDLETLFERALDLYVEQLQKKRFGKTDRPRKRAPDPAVRGQRVELRKRAHLSHETRRQVVAKEGLRCAFVSSTGQRCGEQSFLQFHHDAPWARTRDDRPENLHVFCAFHNRFMAERDFGEQQIAQRIEDAKARRATATTALADE